MIVLWIIPAVALLIGAGLLRVGLRGRRVDDHPICRRCGFDLFGRPEGSNICSECGGDLTKRHAIRAGRHVRRGGMIAIGALMLAITLTLGGGAGYAAYSVKDWQPHKPVWWLVRELDRGDLQTRRAATTELLTRLAGLKLSRPQLDRITETILNIQGDTRKPWYAGFGDFLEAARAKKQLSDERWQRYGRQAVDVTLDVRQWVRRGDVLPFRLRQPAAARIGSRSAIEYPSIIPLSVGGERFVAQPLEDSRGLYTPPAVWLVNSALAVKAYESRLADGPQELRALLDLEIRSAALGQRPVPLATIEVAAPFKLFAPYESTVLVVHDEKFEAEMRAAITASASTVLTSSGRETITTVTCNAPPVGIGCVVAVQLDGRLYPLGMIACPPKEKRQFQLKGAPGNGSGGSSRRLAVVSFFPTPFAAAESVDTFEIWNGIVRRPVILP